MKNQYEEAEITKKVIKYITWAVIGIFLFAALLSAFYTVPAGHRGVITTWGKVSMTTKDEGLHVKVPFAQKATKMSVRTLKYEATAGSASKDLQVVSTEVAVNYHTEPTRVPEIYQELGLAYEQVVIQPLVQESVKAVTAKFTAEELITKRTDVKAGIEDMLSTRLAERGILVEDISLTDFDFSDEFNRAIEAKVTSNQQKLKAEMDLLRIEVEAKQREAIAIGSKNAAIAEAQGQAEAIRIIDETLSKSPQYIEYLTVTKWSGDLPKVMGAGITPMLDVMTLTE